MKTIMKIHGIVLASAFAVAALACGSSDSSGGDDTGTSSSSGGSSGFDTTSSSGSTTSGSSSGMSGGCPAKTIGPNMGTVVISAPRGSEGDGGVKWTDLDNAKATDAAFAKVTLGAGQESEELRITGFGFQLPAGAIFQGVTVELSRQAPDDGILDGQIYLVGIKNQTTGRGKFIATAWPTSIVGVHHYGQDTDTWGFDLNPPDVQTEDFGVGLWVKRNPDGSGAADSAALVDSVRVTVAYCLN